LIRPDETREFMVKESLAGWLSVVAAEQNGPDVGRTVVWLLDQRDHVDALDLPAEFLKPSLARLDQDEPVTLDFVDPAEIEGRWLQAIAAFTAWFERDLMFEAGGQKDAPSASEIRPSAIRPAGRRGNLHGLVFHPCFYFPLEVGQGKALRLDQSLFRRGRIGHPPFHHR